MRIIAIINQKGGCGKTTTSINLAACLARLGQKTLLVDMDPQGHCGVGLAVPEDQIERTLYETLIEESDGKPAKVNEIVWQIASDFDLAPSNIKLAAFEQVFAGRNGREDRLTKALAAVSNTYKWAIIDCPPSVGLITFNALRACDEVIVPVETGFFSLHGLAKMMETLELMKERCSKDILIRVLPTLYDTRTKLAREVLSELRGKFRDYLMESTVNFNTKLKEAASFGQPITEYDPGSRGYKDFVNLARELMGHKPVDVEPAPSEKMSRPAELVQRAKQLSQLTNFQFGRNAIQPNTPIQQQQPAGSGPALQQHLEAQPRMSIGTMAPMVAPAAPAAPVAPAQSAEARTQQKIEEFYGVKQMGDEVMFAVKFDQAKKVSLAGEFNGWSPLGTPMQVNGKPGVFTAKLPLPRGRYRYRIIVDGQWMTDPNNKYVETNEYGELNNVVEVDSALLKKHGRPAHGICAVTQGMKEHGRDAHVTEEEDMDEQQPQQPRSNSNLGEISYLFLSSVREKAGNGAARPQRIPPNSPTREGGVSSDPAHAAIESNPQLPLGAIPQGAKQPAHTIDLTPEEFERAIHDDEQRDQQEERGRAPVPQVTAIVAGHLNGKQLDRAKDYARHLASAGTRIGLIEVDASEFRVMCFDRHPADGQAHGESQGAECSFDPRRMNEVLDELSWDVSRWLLVLPTPRVSEARALLRDCTRWVLLSTCDHDGVIACYRTLKGLTDLWPAERGGEKPTLSLALLDAPDEEQADRVAAKLSSVCQQFLSWPLEVEPTVRAGSDRVGEHLVMNARPTRDKGQLANAPQWQIVQDFIARSKQTKETRPIEPVEPMKMKPVAPAEPVIAAAPISPEPQAPARTMPMLSLEGSSISNSGTTDVIDLPGPEMGESGIVDAILKHCANELVECPVVPPMCVGAKLAVSRERRVVLLAVARQGLADLNTIGQAYKWLQENQVLIGMAVPQLSIDTHQTPHLSLLVDQADSDADTLQPMLEGANVTVKTYRKLRWGGKTGLLLEAA